MGSRSAGRLHLSPSRVSSASLNTRGCGQASLMATDYCFLKFICVRKSFKKPFPHLSLGAPAHRTKPPIWFSTAVNFAGRVSPRLQGNNRAVSSFPSFVSQRAVRIWRGLQSLLRLKLGVFFFISFFFLALQMLSGAPEVENQVCQTEGSDRGYRCYR